MPQGLEGNLEANVNYADFPTLIGEDYKVGREGLYGILRKAR